MTRRVLVDTDTAGDDTQAILLAALADSLELEALTIVAGNVEFDYEVENAKYSLDLADAADVPVYEGARRPLVKDIEHATHVHGEGGGLGGDFFPETGIPSAEGHAVDAIVETVRDAPGEVTLVCIGPLTNVALALQREPELNDLVDEVWVMGGAINTLGNDTPAAEFNFWADPDAAKVVLRELDVTLVDWGLCVRQGTLGTDDLVEFDAADTAYADFFTTVTNQARELNRAQTGEETAAMPDLLTAACVLRPELVTETQELFVDVDEREGMTRGYSLGDEHGITDNEPRTRLVRSIDEDRFKRIVADMLLHGDPERSL
jgi:purine nucleosidase